MNAVQDIVAKLWRLCAILRKDGITYQQYVTELTYLLFLKMMQEKGKDGEVIPGKYRWRELMRMEGKPKLDHYRDLLANIGSESRSRTVTAIFENANTFIREPKNLDALTTAIDELHWFTDERDSFGDLYEGLLQKNAEETKRGAGQYFTPRPLITVMTRLMAPQAGETIQDPAAGTGGFLIAADTLIREATDDYFELDTSGQTFQANRAYQGIENVPGVFRLLLMNLQLHGVGTDRIDLASTLAPHGAGLDKADLILTNPPFGPAGGKPTRDDFTETHSVSSYQLPFVEHCIRALKPGGRAAVIVPDNVLFEDGRGKALRRMLMNWCDLHTILRLPTGIFYAQGVKTNVIFFTRGQDQDGNTPDVWVYDLRANMQKFGKTAQLREDHFADFEAAFGADPLGRAARQDEGEEGRFRRFTREEIAARGDNLDITWLRDDEEDPDEGLDDPDDIAAAILGHLGEAMREIEALSAELAGDQLDVVEVAAE
ncbi:MAG: N-6 DNA methylase [Pseudomonadota bacterium]